MQLQILAEKLSLGTLVFVPSARRAQLVFTLFTSCFRFSHVCPYSELRSCFWSESTRRMVSLKHGVRRKGHFPSEKHQKLTGQPRFK